MMLIQISDLPYPEKGGEEGWPWNKSLPSEIGTWIKDQTIPKISIITPSFNQGHFIEETIRSVLLQDYPNIEYIVIDGGSSDNSVDIIKKYEPWITYWVSERDNGQCEAINKGFKKSSGEIVAWLNSDDIYYPVTFHKIIDYFYRNPDVSVVYGDYQNSYEDNHNFDHIVKSGEFDYQRLIKRDFIGQPTVFFRRNVLFEVGLLDESYHNSLDYDLLLKLGLKYKFGYIPEPLAVYRWHTASKSQAQTKKFAIEDFIIIDKIFMSNYMGPEYRETGYSHIIQSLIISSPFGGNDINLQKNNLLKTDSVPDLSDGYLFFDYLMARYHAIHVLEKWAIGFNGYKQELNEIISLLDNRYPKLKKYDFELPDRWFADLLIWEANYLFINREKKKSKILLSLIIKKNFLLILNTNACKLLVKHIIGEKGVSIFDTYLNKTRVH
jgi:glycosyltransferase involved in cell wall biosynthesis